MDALLTNLRREQVGARGRDLICLRPPPPPVGVGGSLVHSVVGRVVAVHIEAPQLEQTIKEVQSVQYTRTDR